KLNETRGAFVRALESENRQVYFNNNTGYVVVGLLLSGLLLVSLVLLDVMSPLALILCVAAGVGIGLFAGIAQSFWKGNLLSRAMLIVWGAIVVLNMGGGLLDMFSELRIDTPLIAAASIALINIVFAILMRAPTVQGRKVMDQIDGFR